LNLSLEFVFVLLQIFLGLSGAVIVLLFYGRYRRFRKHALEEDIQEFILSILSGNLIQTRSRIQILTRRNKYLMITQLGKIKESVAITDKKNEELVARVLTQETIDRLIRELRSGYKYRRIRAAVYLGDIGTAAAIEALISAVASENNYTVLQYIANSLAATNDPIIIPLLIGTLPHSSRVYQRIAIPMITNFGARAYEFIEPIIDSPVIEMQNLVLEYCSIYLTPDLKDFIITTACEGEGDLAFKAVSILYEHHPKLLDTDEFFRHPNLTIRSMAIQALGHNGTRESIDRLTPYLVDPDSVEDAIVALSTLLRKKPFYIPVLLRLFEDEKDRTKKTTLAKVLSFRIEYFLVKLLSDDKSAVRSLLLEILELGQSSAVIGFLNRNNDLELEDEILAVISEAIRKNEILKIEMQSYLNDSVLQKLRIAKLEIESKRPAPEKDVTSIRILWVSLIFSLSIIPAYFTISNWDLLSVWTSDVLIKRFIIQYNYALVYYSGAINALYIIVLAISIKGISAQRKYWLIKRKSLLFREGVLPSISVIAPAYNEVANIIESTNSLLNLSYPEYELLVINDGSSDQTLNRLIEYFDLEKVDLKIDIQIPAMPIRGVYASKNIPKLIVVDKANGGKADSLNVGINIAKHEYVCGIDADSLLEEDALLKIAAGTIDSSEESVAAGGNILPVNGCEVDRGHLNSINIPSNTVARFQTIEYMRAFLAGRVGWAEMRSLLIISGAFGLFRKKRVLQIGGYMTASGQYRKDTVGEDMELVVRLSRFMLEKKVAHKFHYIFNANCWTEVPESMNILYRQRDRWQRGLLDILTYHRKMIANPSYGTTGLVAFPYFVVFEAVGPLFELQGYIMVIMAGIFGLLNAKIALLLFISTILMGVFISSTSLLIAGAEVNRFTLGSSFKLLLYAVIENFGFRQVLSLLRVTGFFSSLKKPKGWGTMVRKGMGTAIS
jgi:cellulose synthase/poly-beta-1,6-N-acetylglucosamine synthase-like glycosyltransferase/HEAT repeat protein